MPFFFCFCFSLNNLIDVSCFSTALTQNDKYVVVESEKNDGGEDGQASQVQISTVQPKPISIQRRSFKRKLQFWLEICRKEKKK